MLPFKLVPPRKVLGMDIPHIPIRLFLLIIMVPAAFLMLGHGTVDLSQGVEDGSRQEEEDELHKDLVFSLEKEATGYDGEEEGLSKDLVFTLAEVAALSPPSPPSSSCTPPTLPTRPNCKEQPGSSSCKKCNSNSKKLWIFSGLTGELLTSPRKLVLLLLFSFEADTLEVKTRFPISFEMSQK